jgi:hypothetical protein
VSAKQAAPIDERDLLALDRGLFDAIAPSADEETPSPSPPDDTLLARLVVPHEETRVAAPSAPLIWPLLIATASGAAIGAAAAVFVFQDRIARILARW